MTSAIMARCRSMKGKQSRSSLEPRIVDNMPGAGGLVSANHLFKVAKPDGLTIRHLVGGQFLQQLLGKPGIVRRI
jgi:tripartite-type tricarboxylate transporter receptor subunit TctC